MAGGNSVAQLISGRRIILNEVITSKGFKIPRKTAGDSQTHGSVYRGPARLLVVALALSLLLLIASCGSWSSQSSSLPQQGLATPPPPAPINSYFGTDGDVWGSKIDHSNNQITGHDITLNGDPVTGTFSVQGGFLDIS